MSKGDGSKQYDVILVSLGDITEYRNNPRMIPEEAVKEVADSIRRFGFRQPIVVDKDKVIVAGHTRYRAAKMLNLNEVPVHVMDGDETDVKAYRIADNSTGYFTQWDMEQLANELDQIINLQRETGNIDTESPVPGWSDTEIDDILEDAFKDVEIELEADSEIEEEQELEKQLIERVANLIWLTCPNCAGEFLGRPDGTVYSKDVPSKYKKQKKSKKEKAA